MEPMIKMEQMMWKDFQMDKVIQMEPMTWKSRQTLPILLICLLLLQYGISGDFKISYWLPLPLPLAFVAQLPNELFPLRLGAKKTI